MSITLPTTAAPTPLPPGPKAWPLGLPLLRAMEVGTPEERQLVRDAIEHRNGMDHLERILGILDRTGALEYSRQVND